MEPVLLNIIKELREKQQETQAQFHQLTGAIEIITQLLGKVKQSGEQPVAVQEGQENKEAQNG